MERSRVLSLIRGLTVLVITPCLGAETMLTPDSAPNSYSGELADGAALPLPVGSGLRTKVATVTVAATDGAVINESAYFMVGAQGSTLKVAGTESTSTTSSAGRLCLVPGSKVELINRLGARVDVVITVFWR